VRGRKPRDCTCRGEACLALSRRGSNRAADGCTIERVRRLLKWIIVPVGIAALVRWFKRRGAETESTAPSVPAADDPAEELRRKLAESRDADESDEPAEAPEATVEERRADVHEQGRAALDEMKPSDEG
jgi:hypothetical protein